MGVIDAQNSQLGDIYGIDLLELRESLRGHGSIVTWPVRTRRLRRFRVRQRRARRGCLVFGIRFSAGGAGRGVQRNKEVARQASEGGHLNRKGQVQKARDKSTAHNESAADNE